MAGDGGNHVASPHDSDQTPDPDDPYPPVPVPPPPPPIPDVLQRPVHRPASMTQRDSIPSATFLAASGYASAFSFIVTALGFGALGWGVDWLAGTAPWGLVVGLGVGFVGGTFRLVREANRPLP